VRALAVRRSAQPRSLLFTLITTAFTLAACGGDDGPAPPPTSASGGGNAPATPFPPTNGGTPMPSNPNTGQPAPSQPSSPQQPNEPAPLPEPAPVPDSVAISGQPPTSVREDTTYDFLPEASGPDESSLVFAIENKPEWASFETSTGRLTGKPDKEHVGSYPGIVIQVSDGDRTASLETFSIDVVPTASGAVSLSWDAPTERSDGTPLLDLAGYKIYWGTVEGEYANSASIDNPSVTSYVVEELTPAYYYMVATAVDSDGIESQFSNVVEAEIN
jgi:hypothetical protein